MFNEVDAHDRLLADVGLTGQPIVEVGPCHAGDDLPGELDLCGAGIDACYLRKALFLEPEQEAAVAARQFRNRAAGARRQPRAHDPIVNVSLLVADPFDISQTADAAGGGLILIIVEVAHYVVSAPDVDDEGVAGRLELSVFDGPE